MTNASVYLADRCTFPQQDMHMHFVALPYAMSMVGVVGSVQCGVQCEEDGHYNSSTPRFRSPANTTPHHQRSHSSLSTILLENLLISTARRGVTHDDARGFHFGVGCNWLDWTPGNSNCPSCFRIKVGKQGMKSRLRVAFRKPLTPFEKPSENHLFAWR